MPPYDNELGALATHLASRRKAILSAWRAAVTSDPTLTTGASLPRAQLHDHIPALLIDLERRLATTEAAGSGEVQQMQRGDAAAHGLHRWQQGFDLAEVTREMGRLNECVVAELDQYDQDNARLDRGVMACARRLWAQQYGTAISASTSQYFRLQQLEANGHIAEMERALGTLRELEQQRAQLWQQAAHDLRGNLGVVANATAGLFSSSASDGVRGRFLRLLDRNVDALHDLLDDVTSLARLQGGLEQRTVEPIDITPLLRDLCEGLRVQAQQRRLTFEFSGPPALLVQGDAVKIRRITQNLVLNAVRYTEHGSVSVSWGDSDADDPERWQLQIVDTGPGLGAGANSEIAGALEAATDQARQVTADSDAGAVSPVESEIEIARSPRPAQPSLKAGEGIGLSIVKRLCDLLDATVELRSEQGVGTSFRILLPRRYGG
ncbi:MAG: sensor histidine kinase [Proteobacteria bacterium]|nr:sensor histidine kinase [Burkholderiales bacterium]